MKKTKLLTSLAALALVVGLGACEVNVDVGGVDVGVDVNPDEDTSGETHTHEYEITDSKEATCTDEGYITYTCVDGDDTYTEKIDALGHDWQEVSNTATCTEAGLLTEQCSRCGATQTTDVDALGHDPQGEYHCDGEDADEYHYQYCSRCGEAIEEEHDLTGTATPVDENYHKVTCALCGHEVKTGHDIVPDVYTDSGDGEHCYLVCETCGYQELHNHVWGAYESDGTNHWKSCTRCGAKTTQEACEFTDYGYDEETHWVACSVCGAISGDPVAHEFTESTSNQRGHALSCACGYTSDFEEHNYVDVTTPYALEDGHTHAVKQCADCGYILAEAHQLETESDTTCSVCGATGLYGGGITYEYSETLGGYIVSQKGFSDTSKTELYIPNTYNGSPVVGTADGTKYAEGAFYDVVSKLTFIGLPNSFVHIGNYAFGVSSGTGTITSLYIPASVEYIGTYSFRYQVIDELVFEPGSKLTEIGTYAFQGCTFTEVELPDSLQTLGTHSLRQCAKLEYVNLGAGVTALPDSLFYNDTALKEVVYSDETTSIGGSTFYGCTSLESIVIPQTVTSIGYNAFAGANNLSTIYYGGTAEEWTTLKAAADNNSAFINSSWGNLELTVLYYSETELAGGWHYVAGVPTAW